MLWESQGKRKRIRKIKIVTNSLNERCEYKHPEVQEIFSRVDSETSTKTHYDQTKEIILKATDLLHSSGITDKIINVILTRNLEDQMAMD